MASQEDIFEVLRVADVRPLRDIPDRLVQRQQYDLGANEQDGYALIVWGFKNPQTGKKQRTAPRDSWEPLANILDDEMRAECEQRLRASQASTSSSAPATTKKEGKKRAGTKRSLPPSRDVPGAPIVSRKKSRTENPDEDLRETKARLEKRLEKQVSNSEILAKRTTMTRGGRVEMRILRMERHPIQRELPAFLVEEIFPDGSRQETWVGAHLLTQDWRGSLLDKMMSQIGFRD